MTLPKRVGVGLFPLALAGGFFLLVRNTPPPPVHGTIDCARAIEIARGFLHTSGSGTCSNQSDNNLISFVNAKADRQELWKIAPPISVLVKFPNAQVTLTVDGHVTGFKRSDESADSGPPFTKDEALAAARTYLPAGYDFGQPSVFDNGKGRRDYTFRSSKIPGARVTAEIGVEGRSVRSVGIGAKTDEGQHESGAEIAQTIFSILGGIFASFVALFSIYRYATRTLQQEISHKRSLIVALFCGVFAMLLGTNAVVNSENLPVSFGVILLVFAIMGILGGALVAAAYGSGEGDVREAFPGKLTSLDTLLTGRLFSQNTGASILAGLAYGGWLVLALGLMTIPFRTTQPFATQNLAEPFIRLHWLMPFVTYPLLALGIAAAGLMQPAAFLQRNLPRAHRWHIPVLVLCTFLASLMRAHAPTTGEFLVGSAVFVAAVLVPFFLHDLLATLICVTAVFSTAGLAGGVRAVPEFAQESLAIHILIAAGLTVFGIAGVWRGKRYTEEQVRPLYARHIAERKSLEAEVSAAREAQLRLLPEKLPELAGLYISAACVPAETVGGDFYDFFPLGNGRLGVFLAEGNNRGLAAALTIALAKGYLMHCVEKWRQPVEILTRLEAMLASIFPGDTALTDFAFASIDTIAGEVEYARTGAYPKVVVVSNTASAMERPLPVKGRTMPITEGRASLAAGDHVVLFTDGIGRRLAMSNRKPEEAASDLVAKTPAHQQRGALGTDEICHRLLDAAKRAVDPDDLTVVVIQIHALAQSQSGGALEAVA